MSNIHAHKIANKYALDDLFYGDAETTSLATGAVAEALKMAGGIAAAEQKKKEDKARADKEKADADAKAREQATAAEAAQKARQEADLAALKAANEANTAGPLHQAALVAEQRARAAEMKAYGYSGGAPQGGAPSRGFQMPTWGWIAIGATGLGLGTWLVVSLVRR